MKTALLFAAALALPAPALASTTIDFSGTNYTALFGSDVPPIATLSGSFTYDTLGPSNFVLTGFSLDVGSKHFGFDDVVSQFNLFGQLSISGLESGLAVSTPTTDGDFGLYVPNFDPSSGLALPGPGVPIIYYSVPNVPSIFGSTVVELSVHTGAVPEPATWAMMLLGFGAIGLAIGRKRRGNYAVA